MDDWNDLVDTGLFSVSAEKNGPLGNSKTLWLSALVIRVNGNVQFVTQLAMAPNSGVYYRSRHIGTWTPWRSL